MFQNLPFVRQKTLRRSRSIFSVAMIGTRIGNRAFDATGATKCLKNGDRLEVAQVMAAHESARTTGLYDRRGDQIRLDDVERIVI